MNLHKLATGLVGLALAGLATGWFGTPYVLSHGTRPLVLAGSGNVYPFLQDLLPNLKSMEPLWLDIGSRDAQSQAFAAFDYGRLAASPKRAGFVAMSSDGTEVLETLAADSQNDPNLPNQRDNRFLIIKVGELPLAVLYRGAVVEAQLNAHLSDQLPPDGSSRKDLGPSHYRYVRFSDVAKIARQSVTKDFVRYFPGANAGTTALFQKASQTFQWPTYGPDANVLEVPDYIEQLQKHTSFIAIISYPQVFQRTGRAATGDDLRRLGIKSAVICADGAECNELILADYRLIMKVALTLGPFGNRLTVMNSSECSVARLLTSRVDRTCELESTPNEKLILVTSDLPSRSGPTLPSYLLGSP